jgi:ATP-dependent RNA helicase DDX24/MAK5
LDIPQVDQVIHFHLPRSADSYIHRSGRTARGKGSTGCSISLIAPEDIALYNKLNHSLKKSNGLMDYSINSSILVKLAERLSLAKQLDSTTHSLKKVKADHDWFKNAAKEADIALSDTESDEDNSFNHKKSQNKVSDIQYRLNTLLMKPILNRRYINIKSK